MHLKKKVSAYPVFNDNLNLESQINQVDTLVNNTRQLLCEDEIQALSDVRMSLESLEHWMSCYRSGLAAANRLSTRGSDILQAVKERLEDSFDKNDQNSLEQTEALKQSLRRLEKLMFPIGQMFCVHPLQNHE